MTKQEKGTKDGVTLNFRIDLTLHSALIVGWTNYRNTTGDKMPMHDYIPKVLNAGIKAMKK